MKNQKWFKFLVIAVVLIIPFMYSFFYLKAYWNPYGEGNIDNLPVAIVNSDKGDKGDDLIQSIKDSKKLKISVVSEKKANNGLNDGTYYAVINIPDDFTSSMESISSEDKHHATITYSPNQKSNYLSSQIINTVVLTVEKNLDNKVNSQIVSNLTEKLESVPEQLNTISDGFEELSYGTNQLENGAKTLKSGTNTLNENYSLFNEGVKQVSDGSTTLSNATNEFSTLNSSIDELVNGVDALNQGASYLNQKTNEYVNGTNTVIGSVNNIAAGYCNQTNYYAIIEQKVNALAIENGWDEATKNAIIAQKKAEADNIINSDLCSSIEQLVTNESYKTLANSGTALVAGTQNLSNNLNTLNVKVSGFSSVKDKLNALQSGIKSLNQGANKLYTSSLQIQSGINELNNGATTLSEGTTTLNSSVNNAKVELNSKIDTTKAELKKLDGLDKYSEEPIKVETTPVNEISSYGTAFAPLFISIALWVGSLMMFIILYYDKDERFGVLGINSENRIKRTICYHVLATLSGLVLGILLQMLLDFEITNVLLYYISIILISNCFLAIMQFLIGNFGDIGKFVGLIILVLQLAAAGGTFPIETVTKGFRFLNPILPMTYTIKLLKESLVSIEGTLLTKNLLIVSLLLIILVVINVTMDIIRTKKSK